MLRLDFISGALALATAATEPATAFGAIERRTGGRLGVLAVDLASGLTLAHRARERFPLASTFKLPLAASVLARVDAGTERLDRALPIRTSDLLAYAPDVAAAIRRGARTRRVGDLCAAAVEHSDNAAANLLLPTVGGPAGVTRFAHAHGAGGFRLDRNEPALNGAALPDPRDTTTPEAMVALLAALWRGSLLGERSRARLLGWMEAVTTGDARLRAGVPRGWRVADKTGTTDRAGNDVGLLVHERRTIAIAVYVDAPAAGAGARDAAIRDVARAVTTAAW